MQSNSCSELGDGDSGPSVHRGMPETLQRARDLTVEYGVVEAQGSRPGALSGRGESSIAPEEPPTRSAALVEEPVKRRTPICPAAQPKSPCGVQLPKQVRK